MKTYFYAVVAVLSIQVLITEAQISGFGCPAICPTSYTPICGSDGVTYTNECKLLLRNCRNPDKPVIKVFVGTCMKEKPKPKACPTICTADYTPVCGSNGKTYSNKCRLNVENCVNKTDIEVDYEGECKRACLIRCSADYTPVCGSDGKTYSNGCQLDVKNCRDKTNIQVDYAGECKSSCPTICTADYRPVCGTDGKTYSNRCQLDVINCRDKTTIAVDYDGECKVATNPCPEICPLIFDPKCGTDGITYSSLCHLELDNCKNKNQVFLAYDGACRQNTPAMCTTASAWKVGCNWCRCSFGQPSCTKRRCLPGDNNESACVAGSRWRLNCNWCGCSNGKPSCTSLPCGGTF